MYSVNNLLSLLVWSTLRIPHVHVHYTYEKEFQFQQIVMKNHFSIEFQY